MSLEALEADFALFFETRLRAAWFVEHFEQRVRYFKKELCLGQI